MTIDRDLDRVLAQYFEDGPTEIADRVVTSALETIVHTPQARLRLRLPWRLTMQHPLRLAAVPVSAVIVVAVAAGLLNRPSQPPIATTPSPPPTHVTASPSASPSAAPEPSVTPSPPAAGPPLIAYIHRETDPVTGTFTFKWHVWTVEPGGSNSHRLNAEVSVDPTVLAWSPDGSRVLAYAQGFPNVDPETSPGVYAFDIATGSATQLTACVAPCFRDADPELSADGSTLLVVRQTADANAEPAESFLVSIDLATRRETEVPGTRLDSRSRPCGSLGAFCGGPQNRSPSLSPDGRFIAVARMEEVGVALDAGIVATRGDIVVMNSDGSSRGTLDLGGLSASDPRWSPDGARILFSSYRQDYPGGTVRIRRDVYTVSADGTDLRRLTIDGNSAGATWTSDGRIRFIRFERDGGATEGAPSFWVMGADGGKPQQLTDASSGSDWATITLSSPAVGWRPGPQD